MIDPSQRAVPRLASLGFGGDWNPEQWQPHVWDEDIALMRTAGVNLVTLGVFSWAWLEPVPDQFEFGWLDTILDKCLAAGIAVDLATGTASPPPWLGYRWPESLPVTEDGARLSYGARQQYCSSSSAYRERALLLARKVAERYSSHEAVVMWHVGNEYGAHTPSCWCDSCAIAFRRWLEHRYGGIDALNLAWSTSFWSQRYSEWDEVIPPRRTPYFPNPAQQLDFKAYSSDALLSLFTAERDVIREFSPADRPITTNFMGFFPHADYWKWAGAEDVVSNDWYPDLARPDSHVEGAASADLMRSLKAGQSWLLMEQAVSAINWRAVNPPKSSAEYRRWSLQQVSRGADAILHFQWRASAGGAEKWHSAMLPHAGPRTRSWAAVVALGQELAQLGSVAGGRTRASVAILLDWRSWWALELDSRPTSDQSTIETILSWYQPLWERGYSIDFANPEADLTPYALVLVPQLYSVTDDGAANIAAAVERGASVAIGYFSGAVDECDRVRLLGYPAPWRDLLGLWIEEYRPLLPGTTVLVGSDSIDGHARTWTEHLHIVDAEAILTYQDGDLSGLPAVTRRTSGTGGDAWYVSARLDPATLASLLTRIADESAAVPILDNPPPAGVEVALRETDDASFLFLLNHANDARTVNLSRGDARPETTWRALRDDLPITSEVIIEAGDVLVLVAQRQMGSVDR